MEKQKGKGVRDGDNGHEHCSPCSSSGAGAGVIGARHHNLHHHVFRDPAEQVRNDGSSIGGSGLRNDRDYQPQGVELEVGEASTAEDFMYSLTVSSDQYHQQPMFEPHNHPWSTLQQPMPHLHHPSHFIDGSSTASVVSCSTTSSTAAAAAASSSTVMMGADNMVNNNPSREDCGSHANLAPMSLIGGAPPLPYSYGAATDYYARRAALDLQYGGYTIDPATLAQLPYCDPLTLSGFYGSTAGLSQEALFRAATAGVASGGLSLSSVTSSPFGSLQSEFSKMTAQEIMDAKALAASKSHSEAERRRRERINGHLARLRSLLPNTTKTDKASLLAEVIQHVKELKRQTSEIAEESPVPSESDELTVDVMDDGTGTSSDSNSGPARLLVRASICCDDRSDLLPELIRALKALRLRALKAEIVTLGGRVRNVLVVTEDHESDDGAAAANPGTGGTEHDGHNQQQQRCSVNSIQEALKAVMERATTTSATEVPDEPSSSAAGGASSGGGKRQRTNSLSSILENRSI